MPKKNNNGFSLVEVMIVTFIFTMAFIAIVSLIKQAISLSYANKNSFLSVAIAQQGLELSRTIRDQNWMIGYTYHFATNLVPKNINTSIEADDLTKAIPSDGSKAIGIVTDWAVVHQDSTVLNRDKAFELVYSNQSSEQNLSGLSDSGDISEYVKDPRFKIYECREGTDQTMHYRQKGRNTVVDGCTETPFHRLMEYTYHNGGTPTNIEDDYLYVKAVVYWNDRGKDHYYVLPTYLTNYSWVYKYGK